MNNFFDIFSSKAKIKVLRTLYFQPQAIPLRHIAYISDLPIYSVQNAVKLLLKDRIIKKTKRDNYVLFELNRKNPLYNLLEQLFIIEMNNRICMEAKKYYQKAMQVLNFANTVNILFRNKERFTK